MGFCFSIQDCQVNENENAHTLKKKKLNGTSGVKNVCSFLAYLQPISFQVKSVKFGLEKAKVASLLRPPITKLNFSPQTACTSSPSAASPRTPRRTSAPTTRARPGGTWTTGSDRRSNIVDRPQFRYFSCCLCVCVWVCWFQSPPPRPDGDPGDVSVRHHSLQRLEPVRPGGALPVVRHQGGRTGLQRAARADSAAGRKVRTLLQSNSPTTVGAA